MKFTLKVPFEAPRKNGKATEATFKITKEFQTKTEVTPRTVQVAEAFGLGIDETKTFAVFKEYQVEINPGDIVYITGDSGSGKSVLLGELVKALSSSSSSLTSEFGKIVTDKDLDSLIRPNEVLVEGVGKDISQAVNILSMTGLNEAFLMLRRFRELSDGQKYRYKLAKALSLNFGTLAFDEFCATLDRTTAKVVAYTIQKTCRKLNRTLLAATTHEDLVEDINPSVRVDKRFGHDVRTEYINITPPLMPTKKPFSLLKDIVIEPGTKEDYKTLGHFHYLAGSPKIVRKIFRARLKLGATDQVIGVLVYGPTIFNLAARNECLPSFRPNQSKSMKEHVMRINDNFVRIWRVIVEPKFRSVGLGVKLVKDTLPLTNYPYVETLAVMARYNPFFEKAGMVRIDHKGRQTALFEKALMTLEDLGFSIDYLRSKNANLSHLESLSKSPDKIQVVQRIALSYFMAAHMRNQEYAPAVKAGNLDAIATVLSRGRYQSVYLVWKNPDPKFAHLPTPIPKILNTG